MRAILPKLVKSVCYFHFLIKFGRLFSKRGLFQHLMESVQGVMFIILEVLVKSDDDKPPVFIKILFNHWNFHPPI